jgi:hypothetical protein
MADPCGYEEIPNQWRRNGGYGECRRTASASAWTDQVPRGPTNADNGQGWDSGEHETLKAIRCIAVERDP